MSDENNYPRPGQGQVHGAGATWNPHTGQWEQAPAQQAQPYWDGQPQPSYWDGQQWVPGQHSAAPAGGPPTMEDDLRAALDEVKDELDQRTASWSGDKPDYYKTKQPQQVGETTESVCRLLPAWPGKEQTAQPRGMFWKEYVHFVWVPSQDQPGRNVRTAILCEREMTPAGYHPAPCAVCERRDQAEREGDQKLSQSLQARPRFLFNLIDLEDQRRHWKQDPATGGWTVTACVGTFGPGLMKKLIAIFHQRQNVAHLQWGRSIVIMTTKVGKAQRDVRYDALDRGEPCPVPQGFENVQLIDLSKVTPRRDYGEIAAQLRESYPPRQQSQAPQGYYQPPQQAQPSAGPPPGLSPGPAPGQWPPAQQGAAQAPQPGPAQQSQPPYGNPYGPPPGGPPPGGPPPGGPPPGGPPPGGPPPGGPPPGAPYGQAGGDEPPF